ncbi:MAG: uracil phosphoribosyltransferase [Defluviitaleaceae bacterium]|nr:uracil phosphoribosyltransferase [Defluviitaleaceae bacterium]
MGEFHVSDHPLIESKMAKLRDVRTGAKEFREIASEITALLFYEAARSVLTAEETVMTPICETKCKTIGVQLAVVPILRAGLGMVNGILSLMPTTKVGHIGIFRNPETLEPVEYFSKLPSDCAERVVFLTDPMLATGGTAAAAVSFLKEKGVPIHNIKFLCLIACPEGVKRLQGEYPDVDIYAAAYDVYDKYDDGSPKGLNDHGYIVPGLGDAGDRIFGTK